MKTRILGGAITALVVPIIIGTPAHAAPQPNTITAVCADGVTYTATAPSQASSVARGTTQDGQPFTLSIKAADSVELTGVPRELLTRCDVYINGVYLIDGYALLSGPGR